MPRLLERRTYRTYIVLIIALGLLASSWSGAALAWQDPVPNPLSELPISFPVQSPEIADYFEEIARPEDTATFGLDGVYLLQANAIGQKMLAFRSWAEAKRDLEAVAPLIDAVMYNPEHWELTPQDEQQNLVETVQQFAKFTHALGLHFMFAPDRRYAEGYLEQVAPFIDAVLLQGQRLQQDPEAFAAWIAKMVDQTRAANPEVKIYVQVGATAGPAIEMYTATQRVASDIDGIAIWSMPRSLDVLQEFVTMLRESPPQADTKAAVTPTAAIMLTVTIVPTVATMPTQTASAQRAPTSLTPAPTAVALTGSHTATSTPHEVTVSAPTATLVPASATPMPEAEQVGQTGQTNTWIERIALLVVGMVMGFLLGFVFGRRPARG